MSHQNPIGTFCWVEGCMNDLPKARQFYETVFGWNTQMHDMPNGQGAYLMMSVGQDGLAGLYEITDEMRQQNISPYWGAYVSVDEIHKATNKAQELGASVLLSPLEVMGMGFMSVLADPTGAIIHLWQSKNFKENALTPQTPGNVGWVELQTTDTEKAKTFYSKLFGWEAETQTMENGMEYTSFLNHDHPVGGMLAIRPEWIGARPNWQVYFTVSHFDKTAKIASEIGAKMVYEPKDVAGVGRFSTFQDPQGAYFSLIQFDSMS